MGRKRNDDVCNDIGKNDIISVSKLPAKTGVGNKIPCKYAKAVTANPVQRSVGAGNVGSFRININAEAAFTAQYQGTDAQNAASAAKIKDQLFSQSLSSMIFSVIER